MTSTIRSKPVEARIRLYDLPCSRLPARYEMYREAERQGIKLMPMRNVWDLYEIREPRPPYKSWTDLETDELIIQQWPSE